MFVLVTMTDRTETISCKQTRPMFLNTFDVKASRPFVVVIPLLSLLVNSRRGSGGRRFQTLSSQQFLIGPNKLEFIVIMHVYGIEGCALKGMCSENKIAQGGCLNESEGNKGRT
jgi:hypothetical protein